MQTIASIILGAMLGLSTEQSGFAAMSGVEGMIAPAALSDDEVRAQVLAYLSTIDTPIRAAAWQALGARAEPILREIISNRDNFPTRRAKAIDGLTAVGGAAAAPVFREFARSESEPLVLRLAALRALAQVTEPRALVAEMAPLLTGAGDSRVRASAGEVLVRRSGRGNCGLIRAQAANEPADNARHFERVLTLCGQSHDPR